MNIGEGPVALVTGASSGIGKATARAFASAGYTTIIADVHEQEGADAATECEREGAACRFIRCDVSDEASVKNLISQIVSGFGRLDAAFNNAGIEGAQAPVGECTTENFDRVIGVNLRGVFFCMREELRQMWMNTTQSREQLAADLQAWCRRAEGSGGEGLRQFSFKLRAAHA